MSAAITADQLDHRHQEPHEHEGHEELTFMQKYVFSTDHKVIGVQYGLTSLIFLLVGFFLMMVMRWSIAYPGHPMPVVGPIVKFLLGSGDRWIDQQGAP